MKLIDLLVQELPKIGGWPAGVNYIAQDFDEIFEEGNLSGYLDKPCNQGKCWTRSEEGGTGCWTIKLEDYAEDCRQVFVTKEEYETAIKGGKEELYFWDGKGCPSAGAVVELKDDSQSNTWGKVMIKFYGEAFAVWDDCGQEESNSLCHVSIRPIRTEADQKRDEAISFMNEIFRDHVDNKQTTGQDAIYDAIVVGKFQV